MLTACAVACTLDLAFITCSSFSASAALPNMSPTPFIPPAEFLAAPKKLSIAFCSSGYLPSFGEGFARCWSCIAAAAWLAAEPRPNAYIPDDIGIPKPYGALAPFKPTELGATMRHIRRPQPREIEL